jgi:hypothetical protein
MAYLDQVFIASSLHHTWNKKQCNIVPIASLKLAIKLLELRTMTMDDMLKLGAKMGESFSRSAVVEMEHEIMWQLSWNLFPPTAFCFAHHMISFFPQDVPKSPTRYILQELTKYMTELAVCVYSFVKFKVSSKSFASCLVAMERCVLRFKSLPVFFASSHHPLFGAKVWMTIAKFLLAQRQFFLRGSLVRSTFAKTIQIFRSLKGS